MNFVPWRVKNFLSEHFPLLYHLAVNVGAKGNSPAHWDARLAETWDAKDRCWPTKNELIASLTTGRDRILDIGNGTLRSLGVRLQYSTGAVQRTNCHPFKYKNWIFQHNGHIDCFEIIRKDLQMEIAGDYYYHLKDQYF